MTFARVVTSEFAQEPVALSRPRVLVLSRAYPNDVFPRLGLWTERPTTLLADRCDFRVVSPVPWCPPLPDLRRLRQYSRFRRVATKDVREGIEVHRPRFVAGPGHTLYALESQAHYRAVVPVVDRLRETFPFDLVHGHFIYPDGVVAHRLARRYGVPLVITEHAPWVPQWIERRGVRSEALEAARRAAALIAVSTSVRDSIVGYVGDHDGMRVIPNGVDGELFTVGPEEERDPHQVLYVGVINFNKGIDVLLQAAKRLRAGDERIKIVLAGGSFYRNTRLQRERLEAMADELGLHEHVSFLGEQTPEEVARLMQQSSVVVLPSRAESFGSVLVEALACGTPVVSTRSGGPEDIVRDEVGTLVPSEDAAALADAIATTLAERARYRPARLRDYALRRFGWSSVTAQTFDVYREVLDGNSDQR